MGIIAPQKAREFVNFIVEKYDTNHPASKGEICNLFDVSKETIYHDKLSLDQQTQKADEYLAEITNCSQLLVRSGILAPPLQDQTAQRNKMGILEIVFVTYLKDVNYEKDPISSIVSENLFQIFISAKQHFLSHIFQEAYGKSNEHGKDAIICQLEPFQAQLNLFSFRFQRLIFLKLKGSL